MEEKIILTLKGRPSIKPDTYRQIDYVVKGTPLTLQNRTR